MSAPQSTWCARSYPCFRDRCESGLRVVDAKIRTYDGRLTQPMDIFACQHGLLNLFASPLGDNGKHLSEHLGRIKKDLLA
jgi:hypothetical protein